MHACQALVEAWMTSLPTTLRIVRRLSRSPAAIKASSPKAAAPGRSNSFPGRVQREKRLVEYDQALFSGAYHGQRFCFHACRFLLRHLDRHPGIILLAAINGAIVAFLLQLAPAGIPFEQRHFTLTRWAFHIHNPLYLCNTSRAYACLSSV